MPLRELTTSEYMHLSAYDPWKTIPPQPGQRPVRDTVTNEIRYISGELPKAEHAAPNPR